VDPFPGLLPDPEPPPLRSPPLPTRQRTIPRCIKTGNILSSGREGGGIRNPGGDSDPQQLSFFLILFVIFHHPPRLALGGGLKYVELSECPARRRDRSKGDGYFFLMF